MINPETLLSTETDWVTCIHCPQAKSQDGTLSTINCKRTIFPEKKKISTLFMGPPHCRSYLGTILSP